MALTQQQISSLDIASQRKAAGKATSADIANLNYAAKQGYTYKPAPSILTGAVAIPGAQYNTKQAQQAAFSNIQPVGNTLYGIPKQLSTKEIVNADQNLLEATTANQNIAKANDVYNQESLAQQVNSLLPQIQETQKSIASSIADQSTLQPIQQALTTKQTEIANLNNSFGQGMNAIENKVIPMEFITGQQAAVQRQYTQQAGALAEQEKNIINQLGLAQEAKKAQIEAQKFGLTSLFQNAELLNAAQQRIDQQKQQAFQNAQALSDNARQGLTTMLNLLQGTDPDKMSAETTAQLTKMATDAGVPAQVLFQGMRALKNNLDFEKAVSLSKQSQAQTQQEFENQYKLAQLNLDQQKLNQPTIKTINGEAYEYNPATGETAKLNINAVGATPEQIQTANDTITTVDKLLNSTAFNRSVGPVDAQLPAVTGEGATFRQNFETLRALLALGNLNKLKGPMSDKDIQFIKDASAGLSLSMGEDQFRSRLNEIKERANVVNLKPGELQTNTDGTYSYRNIDGTVHTGRLGDNYVDKTLPQNIDLSGLGFNSVGSDTYKATNYLANYGGVTGEGSPYWKWGLDVDLKKGDSVFSPVSGKVVTAGPSGGFGNRVGVKTPQGNIVYLSHLDAIGVKNGQQVNAGQVIGLGGNSGRTIATKGGDGSHLDITVKKPDGSYYEPSIIRKMLS